MPTVYVETYGCQMNVAETDLVLDLVIDRAGPGTLYGSPPPKETTR